jgi:site-specific recombinase XerD
MLFEKGIELFIENCKSRDLSPKTFEKYCCYLTEFGRFLSELYNRPVYIDEVKAEDMERFLFQHYNPKDYSSSTRHNVITAFHSMYSYLERKKLC